MDYLDEYLSLIQSLKTYHTPKMHLNLKIEPMLKPSKQPIEKLDDPLPEMAAAPTIKAPKAPAVNPSKYPLNLPSNLSALDNTLYATIKKALPEETFYEYLPLGVSHIKKLPSCDLPSVPIFFYKENHFDCQFLTNIISAIQNKFSLSSALVDMQEIEECNLWRSVTSMHHLHGIIVYDTWITICPHGRCWYRRDPNTNNCFLGTIPLIVLSSRADWYLAIDNKKVLWNQLCRILKQPSRKTMTK